jgi:hypothetical protein
VFRLSWLAYLVVALLVLGVIPLAFTQDGSESSSAVIGPRALLLIVPIAVATYIARTATIVDADGIRVRALLGSRRLGWDELRGLSVSGRSVYAVCVDGAVRLPCVRVADLAAVARASDGRLPAIAEATPKYAPSRRRR